MPQFLIKISDRYWEWSTVVDSPITYGMKLDELTEHIGEEYGQAGLDCLPQRLERVEQKGTSSRIDKSLDDVLALNHAGQRGQRLTAEEIYHRYFSPASLVAFDALYPDAGEIWEDTE